MANILEFLTRKKKEIEIVLADTLVPDDETTTFIGEGTEEEYNNQVVADKGLRGIFGLGGGNMSP